MLPGQLDQRDGFSGMRLESPGFDDDAGSRRRSGSFFLEAWPTLVVQYDAMLSGRDVHFFGQGQVYVVCPALLWARPWITGGRFPVPSFPKMDTRSSRPDI